MMWAKGAKIYLGQIFPRIQQLLFGYRIVLSWFVLVQLNSAPIPHPLTWVQLAVREHTVLTLGAPLVVPMPPVESIGTHPKCILVDPWERGFRPIETFHSVSHPVVVSYIGLVLEKKILFLKIWTVLIDILMKYLVSIKKNCHTMNCLLKLSHNCLKLVWCWKSNTSRCFLNLA